ncbi:MFS transporter [Natranaerobius thermophilus]|uniref:Major facilitator superfamily MFS_1 n=1 Tax=Natranaerobius thermophilus (strain ATCC BAA-1301 / DSM 18059 / JW/NM-WN-LF) TaxID=457570 RepID=B2A3C5_NATTJ|nr:MFS transporter [Natranaerobius thermophilus]ACB86354.1 major facilitator superfamily MFS_1 [Natranaerobius thermophilus JW/NM-WN-LF]
METGQEIRDGEVVGKRSQNVNHFPILMVMSTAYIAVGTNVQGFKAMLPMVSADFQIGSAEAGLYTTFFFLSATILAIFSGRVVDRLGSKMGLVMGTAIIGSLMIIHSVTNIFVLLLALAFFTGIGFSIITPSINKGVMELVSPNKRAVSLGITQAGGGIGGILGALLLPFLGELFGWRNAILVSAGVALLMSGILFKFYNPGQDGTKSQQEENTSDSEESSKSDSSFKEDLAKLVTNKVLLTVCLIGLTFGFTISNITTHFPLFLDGDLGYSGFIAGASLAVFQTGGIIGKPSWGIINDRFLRSNRRLGLFILGLLVSLLMLVLAIFFDEPGIPIPVIMIFTFILGVTSLGIPGLFFTTVGDVVDKKLMGTATGLALIFIRTGVVIGPPFIGWLADITGSYQISWITLATVIFILSLSFFILSSNYKENLYGST